MTQYVNLFLRAMRRSGYNVSNPTELRDLKKAIAEYYNAGYAPGDPKRIQLDDNLDDWARIEPFLDTQHKQGFITKEFIREIGDIFDDIRASRSADEVRLDKEYDIGRFATGVNLAEDIPNEVFRNNLIEAFGKGEVEAAVRIKKDSGIKDRDTSKWGIKTSDNWEDELVWLLEGRNHPEHPMLYERVDGAASKYIGNKSNPTPPTTGEKGIINLGVQNEGEAMARAQQMIDEISNNEFLLKPFRDALARGEKFGIFNDAQRQQAVAYADEALAKLGTADTSVEQSLGNIADDLGKINESKKKRNKILNDAIDEILGPEEVDGLMTDDWVDKRITELDRETKIAQATSQEIEEAHQAMAMAVEQGRIEEAKTIADELRRMGVKLDEGGYKSDVPTDMSNILKKPEHAKGGRVGLEGGGNPFDKMKMSRRGFLGLMGSGIAAGVAGAKGWLTGGKTAATAVKSAAEMSASGMPKWFPLLVNKIRTNGNAKPAAYSDVKAGEPNIVVYEYKDPDISIEPIRMEENLDTGVIEVTGRGNESQLVTMTYFAPETAVNVRTGTRSGAKEGEFVVEEMTKHPDQGWIETGAEDYASLKGGVENWEAAVKTKTKQDYKDEYEEFIKNQRGQEEPFDPEGKFKTGGRVGLEGGGNPDKINKERAAWIEKLIRMKQAKKFNAEQELPSGFWEQLRRLDPWDDTPDRKRAINETDMRYRDEIHKLRYDAAKEEADYRLRLMEQEQNAPKLLEAAQGGRVGLQQGGVSGIGSILNQINQNNNTIAQNAFGAGANMGAQSAAGQINSSQPTLSAAVGEISNQIGQLGQGIQQMIRPPQGPSIAPDQKQYSQPTRNLLSERPTFEFDTSQFGESPGAPGVEHFLNPTEESTQQYNEFQDWVSNSQKVNDQFNQAHNAYQTDLAAWEADNVPLQQQAYNPFGATAGRGQFLRDGGLTRTVPPQRGPLANGIGTRFKERQIWQ